MSRVLPRVAASLLALALLACGRDPAPSPPADSFETAVPASRLPVVTMMGDAPSRERSVRIAIAADGTLASERGVTDYAGLAQLLEERVTAPGGSFGGAESRLYFVLRVDRSVPWEVVAWVVTACGRARAYRVLFVAALEGGGGEGALATYLPVSGGLRASYERPSISLRFRPATREFEWTAALSTLESFRAEPITGTQLTAELPMAIGVPSGEILAAIALCYRAGITDVALTGATPPMPADLAEPTPPGRRTVLQEYVAAHPATAGAELSVANRVPVATGAASTPRPALRVRGKFVWVPPGEEKEDDGRDPDRRPREFASHPFDLWDSERGDRFVEGAREGEPASLGAALGWLAVHRLPGAGWWTSGTRWCLGERVDPTPVASTVPATSEVETTALALWAFLRAPPAASERRWWGSVEAVVHRLVERQSEGAFVPRVHPRFLRAQALATLALVEACRRTALPAWISAANAGLEVLAREESDPLDARGQAWAELARAAARRLSRNGTGRGVSMSAVAAPGPLVPDAWALARASGSDEEGRLFEGLAAWRRGAEAGRAWLESIGPALAKRQRTAGDACGVRGSFDPADEPEGDRVRATALAALCLLAEGLLSD